MPVTLQCTDLAKRYPGQDEAALGDDQSGVSFSVQRGELFALLGPSGCGKTTTLRIIGGFVQPDRGSVTIDGKDVTRLPSYRRPTNTVFQSYALFPHMRLGANVGFGLRMSGLKKADQARRVAESLELVGLGGWERRRVTELSGGQQQRAALARALANRPSVLLLDEPLGALDLKLRRQMQDELVGLKRETGTTFVHVTHDQEEACAIADRIAIMDKGKIIQVDTPLALYRHPRTSYVARFIDVGTVLRGEARRSGDVVELTSQRVALRGPAPPWLDGPTRLAAVLPHDRIRVTPTTEQPNSRADALHGVIDRIVFTGSVFDIVVRDETGLEVRAASGDNRFASVSPGTPVALTWDPDDVVFVEDSDADVALPAAA